MVEKQAVVFKVEDETYAIDITEIQEIIEMKEICPIPNSNTKYLKGVINVRGIIIPIISLAERLDKKQMPYTKKARILNVITKYGLIGVIVDELVKVEKLQCEQMPINIEDKLQNTCSHISYLKEKIIPIMDLKKILKASGEKNDK